MQIFISSFALVAAVAAAPSLSIRVRPSPPPAVHNALKGTGPAIEVRRGGALAARFWLIDGKGSGNGTGNCDDRDRVNFCAVGPGSVVGVVRFFSPWRDYRDQIVQPGTYTLRYAIQPHLKDHIGTTMYRDFLMIEPPANKHPFVMALFPSSSKGITPVLNGAVIETRFRGVRAGLVFEGTGHLDSSD